jgi:hypothetical protein
MRSLKIPDIPISEGVYYDLEADNFYSDDSRTGMGMAFFLVWRWRSDEFPTKPNTNIGKECNVNPVTKT